MALLALVAVFGMQHLKVDDSLSELFRTETVEFQRYQEIDRRFPSSEYDVLVVVEGRDLLERPQLEAFRQAIVELQLAEGVNGVVSMLSARGRPDATGYAPPIVPDTLPDAAAYAAMIADLKNNEIVAGKFLSTDGTLAMAVLSLDREAVVSSGPRRIIGGISEAIDEFLKPAGLSVQMTGAPVMQLEIRNAVERDQMVYNGLGLAFGAAIAFVFFRTFRLMLMAALPPILAVLLSLGLLGWLDFRLNLFLNVMTPLVMVLGFADSMQLTYAIRDRLRQGDDKMTAISRAIAIVGPACVVTHVTALVSFLALLLSDSALIRTFGQAGALATIVSYFAVIGALPVIARYVLPERENFQARLGADRAMEWLAAAVGRLVDRVVANAVPVAAAGIALALLFSALHLSLEPRYRLADQVPDREQALAATGKLDQKLTGANPVHVMVQWQDKRPLYDPGVLEVIAVTHEVLEKAAGLGNVWSLDSLRRWLRDTTGDTRIETVERYVKLLPEHLVRRFIAKEEDAVLVTGRLPDIDASEILPVVDTIDQALAPVRAAHPGFEISVTGLPAIAARNSARLIGQLNTTLWGAIAFVTLLIGIAFRSLFVTVLALLPAMFPVVATGAALKIGSDGLEFSSVIALIVVFGLGVDALIHFMNRLKGEERAGEDPAHAIRRACMLVGPPIFLTTIVLAFGLGVTMFSDLPSLRLFGTVCAIALLASIVGDLVFLPATVRWLRRYWPLSR